MLKPAKGCSFCLHRQPIKKGNITQSVDRFSNVLIKEERMKDGAVVSFHSHIDYCPKCNTKLSEREW